MKLILLSDIHATSVNPRARNDNILLASIRKLEYVFQYADEIGADILQAGDLTNSPRDIQFLFRFIPILTKYPNIKLHTITGQHDAYCRNKNVPTNIGILHRAGLINILSKKPYKPYDSFCIYGCSWKEKISKPRHNNFNILVIHAPITTKPLWQGHIYKEPEKFMKNHPYFDLVLCGDIHRDFIYKTKDGRIICNTGPMMRLEATEYNLKHNPKFFIYDTNKQTLKTKIIPHAESSQVMSAKHLEICENNDSLGNIYINTKQVEDMNIMKIIEQLVVASKKEKSILKVIDEIGMSIGYEQ